MSAIATVGSKLNADNGVVTQGKDFCRVEGKPIAHVGSQGTTHPCLPGEGAGAGGAGGYKGPGDTVPPDGGGVPPPPPPAPPAPCLHMAGEWAICHAQRFVRVGGQRVATVGSKTSCKHVVVSGKFVNING